MNGSVRFEDSLRLYFPIVGRAPTKRNFTLLLKSVKRDISLLSIKEEIYE